MANGKRGRTSIQLIPSRLRGLREEKGLSQREVGEALARQSLRSAGSSLETLTHGYQRIERSGRTSPKTASALAQLLGVTVAVLEGKDCPEPADYKARMLALLKAQLEQGGNSKLESALRREVESGSNEEEALEWLADNVGLRIEAAQLARNPDELAELAELTGLPHEKILEPAYVEGHWLVAISVHGHFGTEIVRGTAGALRQIHDAVGDRLDHFGSDGVIRMRRDGRWYRLEIEQASSRRPMRIDFVRCQPTADGLRWLPPSWDEEWWIDEGLREWAYGAANFVSGLDGIQHPNDATRLRLLVIVFTGDSTIDARQTAISAEIPNDVMSRFAREASTHALALNWLGGELHEFLGPRLSEHPKRRWTIAENGSSIDISFWPLPTANDIPHGLRYRIQLVEAAAGGQFSSVPWRRKDRTALKSRIESWLN